MYLGFVSEFLGLSEVACCQFVVTKIVIRRAPAVVGQGELWVEANGLVLIHFGFDSVHLVRFIYVGLREAV